MYTFIVAHVGATIGELAGSIPDGITVILHWPNPRGFDSRWYHWNSSLAKSFRTHCGTGVDSTSNRNEFQEYFLGVKRPVLRADNLTTIVCRLY